VLNKKQFDLNEYFEPGTVIDASIPFFIEGKTIDILEKYVPSFELFSKEELRVLFTTKTEKQIARTVFVRRAKDIFVKVILKEPFKLLLGVVVTFSVYTFQNSMEVQSVVDTKIHQEVQQIKEIEAKESKLEESTLSENFVYTLKQVDGKEVKLKIKAKENTVTNKIDYQVKLIPETEKP
jgi:hypothetical protein